MIIVYLVVVYISRACDDSLRRPFHHAACRTFVLLFFLPHHFFLFSPKVETIVRRPPFRRWLEQKRNGFVFVVSYAKYIVSGFFAPREICFGPVSNVVRIIIFEFFFGSVSFRHHRPNIRNKLFPLDRRTNGSYRTRLVMP